MTRIALLLSLLAADPERDKMELRFVELIRTGLHNPPTEPAAKQSMGEEVQKLLFALAKVDPKNLPADKAARAEIADRVAKTQAEVLQRRDPALAAEMKQSLELFACRSKQGEGKVGLKSIGRMQADWLAEHQKFGTLQELDATAILSPQRYTFELVETTPKHFKARATGKGDMAGDVWEIDEKGEPTNPTNLCDKFKPAQKL